jgi:copper(I)-binding protein
MRFNLKQLAGACATLCLSTSLYAGSAADSIMIEGAFARAIPPGQTNSAAFMSLTNQGDSDHSLAGAESDVSKVVELHTHLMEEGMMKMRRVEKVDLPAGEAVKLEPGGLHVMLIGLERHLSPGEDVEITLIFEDGSHSTLTVPVKKVEVTMKHDKHH